MIERLKHLFSSDFQKAERILGARIGRAIFKQSIAQPDAPIVINGQNFHSIAREKPYGIVFNQRDPAVIEIRTWSRGVDDELGLPRREGFSAMQADPGETFVPYRNMSAFHERLAELRSAKKRRAA